MAKAKGIYKRGSIYWIRYADTTGRIRFESSRSTSFRDAQALLIQRKKEVMDGKDPITVKRISNYSFGELARRYIETWAVRQKTYKKKVSTIRILINHFGNINLKHFTPHLIEEYQSKMLSEGKSPATANRHLTILKHLFTKAVDWEMVGEEVLKRVRRVRLLPESKGRLRFLSKEECKALIDACDSHLKPIVITALNTGMRRGEILNLKWDQVDLRHGFILLDVTKNGERREIPINQTLKEVLHTIPRRIKKGEDNPYVFINPDTDKPYTELKRSFTSALRRAGIKDFRFHDLRHTFASHLVMAGVDITTVKELLGHKTLTMTLRYSHLAPSHKVKAVDILDDALGQKSTIQKLYNLKGVKNGWNL